MSHTSNIYHLWDHSKVLKLTTNMRLTIRSRLEDVNKIPEFVEWILKIGDGEIRYANEREVSIDIPKDILIDDASDPVTSIIEFTYPNLLNHIDDLS